MAPEHVANDDSPFYIRWGPEQSPYAIELKLSLASRIARELERAEKWDVEIGGALMTTRDAPMGTLRIEDVQMFPRGPEDGGTLLLDAEQQQRFAEARRASRNRRETAIGFFRSHCRPGPLKPSIADRTLLSAEFQHGPYVLLLVEARAPHRAAFFIASDSELPKDASVREFRFNEAEFRGLPEMPAEPATPEAETWAPEEEPRRRWIAWIAAALAVLVVAAAAWLWTGIRRSAASADNALRVRIEGPGHPVRIAWNHAAAAIGEQATATLTITDGANKRDVQLSADELRFGTVEYDDAGSPLIATMTVIRPGAAPETETARWPPR